MVLMHVSRNLEEFYYETTASIPIEKLTVELVNFHNRRLQLKRLAGGIKDLAKAGPMRPEELRGLTEEQLFELRKKYADITINYAGDPMGQRVGIPPGPSYVETLNRVADDAESYVSNNQAKLRKPLTLSSMNEHFQTMKGAVMMAYPMGLPEYDNIRRILEDQEDLSSHEDSKNTLDPKTASIWFAGKQFDRDHVLSKYIGNNEKTIIKVKIQGKGQGAPGREPPIDEETRVKMMQMWHKKEKQEKELAEADEDSYLNSAWANPKGFKNSINGLSDVRIRPGGPLM